MKMIHNLAISELFILNTVFNAERQISGYKLKEITKDVWEYLVIVVTLLAKSF